MNLIIQKYGGTSVQDISRIEKIAKHIKETHAQGSKLVVIVSAMGQQTDELLNMAHSINSTPPRRELDMLMTAGERVSMTLLSIALHKLGVKSTSLTGSQCGILTDNTHGNAKIKKILGDRIREKLEEDHVVIVAGFQGVNPETKEVTTLGRGGSDLTAIALSATLRADACQLYKDVPGLLTSDPRIVPKAQFIPKIDWETMTLMSWSGSNILHHRGAFLARKLGIAIEIRSSQNLDQPGTIVKGENKMESATVKAISLQKDLCHVTLRLAQGKDNGLLIAKILQYAWEAGESPIINQQKIISDNEAELELLINEDAYSKAIESLKREMPTDLKTTTHVKNLQNIAIIGSGFKQTPEVLLGVLNKLETKPYFISSNDNHIHLSFKDDKAHKNINLLHQYLLKEKT